MLSISQCRRASLTSEGQCAPQTHVSHRCRPLQARQEMEAFADTYFRQFRKTPMGMMRLDPQDFGPAYRNVIGLPGGTSSPLFDILKVASRQHGPHKAADSV